MDRAGLKEERRKRKSSAVRICRQRKLQKSPLEQTLFEPTSCKTWQLLFFDLLAPLFGGVLIFGALGWLYYAALVFFWPF
jgi:hypothetical protein